MSESDLYDDGAAYGSAEPELESTRQYEELKYRFETTCASGDALEAIETVEAYGVALLEEAAARVKALPLNGTTINSAQSIVIAAILGKEE
jgi:hypothetical protein